MAVCIVPLVLAVSSVCGHAATAAAFAPSPPHVVPVVGALPRWLDAAQTPRRRRRTPVAPCRTGLFGTASQEELEEEVRSMRIPAIKAELESYGVSTKAFLEKGELVDALVEARAEGKTPVAAAAGASSSGGGASSAASSAASSTPSSAPPSGADRLERIRAEMEKAKSLKVSELKSELESYGVSTKSFFEKSEFVRAVAEARVDGVKKSKKKKRRAAADDDEVEEVKAKVEVITNDSVGPKTKKTRDGSAGGDAGAGNPFGGAGGSPFGAAGSPFGGAGGMDMGNIADMLKGMGGMGGAAAGGSPFGGAAGGSPFGGAAGGSPFGGAAGGANPFGGGGAGMADAMKAAQEAMSNPKVRAVVEKAQKNPKVMAAVQECMGNPMAMGKYMSDPEVGPILKELQEAMM